MGMVVGMMYNLYEVSSKYFQYPIAVGISIEHATDLDFPAVTICNVNPVRASLFIANSTTTGSGSSRRRRKRSASKLPVIIIIIIIITKNTLISYRQNCNNTGEYTP